MAIEPMLHLELAAMRADRDALLTALERFGAVELREPPAHAGPRDVGDAAKKREALRALEDALAIAQRHAPKGALRRETIREAALFDDGALDRARTLAQQLRALEEKAAACRADFSRAQETRRQLAPWLRWHFPLERDGTVTAAARLGTLPAAMVQKARQALAALGADGALEIVSSARGRACVALICDRAQLPAALDALRPLRFSPVAFPGLTGTPAEVDAQCAREADTLARTLDSTYQQLADLSRERAVLARACDRLSIEAEREAAREKLLFSGRAFVLTGWLPARMESALWALLAPFPCALTLRAPTEDELSQVPVLLRSNALTRPMRLVTELYSLPAYDGIDPGPLIFPFFTLFFGFMYADLGYGLVLLALGLVGLWRLRRPGTARQLCGLLVLCGIATAALGYLFGGFFGDAPDYPVFFWLRGTLVRLPLFGVVNPLTDPLLFLYASVALGAVHLLFGQVVHLYLCARAGRFADALLDTVPWWLTFGGIALGVLGHGWWLLAVGAAALVLTQGRKRPTRAGRIVGGIKSLYDLTGWLGDLLSYTRLMALLLAGSVIANVFNLLGAMTGRFAAIVVVFLFGHAFNMAINLIGAFVHAARLQYLEFFGKFYRDGGAPFRPLCRRTHYTQIIKEETQLGAS